MIEVRFKKQRGGDLVTYAETISDDGVMQHVFVVERESSGSDQITITQAETGEILFDATSGRRYLELRNGTRYRGAAGAEELEAVRFTIYGELIPEVAGSLRARTRADAIPTAELWGSDDPKNTGNLYWRLSLPVLVPIVTLIAIALSKTDARRGRYGRLGAGLIVFLTYFIALTQSRNMLEAGGSTLGFLMTHSVFTMFALLLVQWEALSKRLALRGSTTRG